MTVVRNVFDSRPRLPDAGGLVARIRLAAQRRPTWWRDEWDDQFMFLVVALIWSAWQWRRDNQVKQRLADVAVPNGLAMTVVCFVLARQRSRSQAWHEASASLSEVSRALTAQRLEGPPAVPDHIPELQASIDSLATQNAERDQQIAGLNEQVVTLKKQLVRLDAWFAGTAIAVVIVAVAAVAVWIVTSR
jgi:hypothetical protein